MYEADRTQKLAYNDFAEICHRVFLVSFIVHIVFWIAGMQILPLFRPFWDCIRNDSNWCTGVLDKHSPHLKNNHQP